MERILTGRWLWLSESGKSLWQDIEKLVIPPMQQNQKPPNATKRHQEMLENPVESTPAFDFSYLSYLLLPKVNIK